jgi:hypothetical protein
LAADEIQGKVEHDFIQKAPIRLPARYDEGKSIPGFVKVYCCSSPVKVNDDKTDSIVDQTVEGQVDDDDEADSIMDQTVPVKVNDDDKTDSIVDQTVDARVDDDETWGDDSSFLGIDWEVL